MRARGEVRYDGKKGGGYLKADGLLCFLVIATSAGCSRQPEVPDRPTPLDAAATNRPDDRSRSGEEVDLGTIAASGQVLRHQFALRNPDDRPLRLLKAHAMMPCCSGIESSPGSIPPGGEGKVAVTFKPGYEAGRRRLEFVIETDSPDRPIRLLALEANIFAVWEFVAKAGDSMSFPTGRPQTRTFRVFSRKIAGDGESMPSEIEAATPLTVRFVGEPSAELRLDGVEEVGRDVLVEIPASSSIGDQRSEIIFRWADGRKRVQHVTWEVRPRLRATPSGLVLKSGERVAPATVVLVAEDAPFTITRVSGAALVDQDPPGDGPRRSHTVRLKIDIERATKLGVSDIRFDTDQPDQPSVTVSVMAFPNQTGADR